MKKFNFIIEVSSGLDDRYDIIQKDIEEALKQYGLQARVVGIAAMREDKEDN